jgi:hypothetical protein
MNIATPEIPALAARAAAGSLGLDRARPRPACAFGYRRPPARAPYRPPDLLKRLLFVWYVCAPTALWRFKMGRLGARGLVRDGFGGY